MSVNYDVVESGRYVYKLALDLDPMATELVKNQPDLYRKADGRPHKRAVTDFRVNNFIGNKIRELAIGGTSYQKLFENICIILDKYPFIKNEIYKLSKEDEN